MIMLLAAIPSLAGEPRKWTNTEGKVIEAEYVKSDDTHVTLLIRDKEVKYALDKLSEGDRDYVARRNEAPPVKADDAKTGWIDHVPIEKPAFATTKEYLEGSNAKAIYKAFDNKEYPDTWTAEKGSAEEMFKYENGGMIVYVPPTYDPAKPMGVYVHINPGDNGASLKTYMPVMDRFSMIYVSPNGTSNNEPALRRVKLAVDSLAEVKRKWMIDEQRVCVGGMSGGGHMAMLTHAMFPQWFKASISHAAQSYLPDDGTCGHFPGLKQSDLTSKDCKGHKWVVISGDKDKNHKEILKTSEDWAATRADYRFIDVPGMGHTAASPEKLAEALEWAGF
jgi:predicted esterase